MPLEATFHPNHQHNTSLFFETDGDSIVTRAFELLGAHTLGSDADSQAARSLIQLIDQSIALQLLPDRSSTILQQDLRVHVLDFLFSQHEAERAMAWIWLWDKIDAVDWRQQVVTEQQRTTLRQRFVDVGREDLVLDVYRMLNKSYMPLTGIGNHPDAAGGFKTAVRLFSPESVTSCFELARHHQRPLSELLRIHQLDKERFVSKSFLYGNIQADKKMDLLCSWTEAILTQRSLKPRNVRTRPDMTMESPELALWREMAMVGMLSSEMVIGDVVRATGVTQDDLIRGLRDKANSNEDIYKDSLLDFLQDHSTTDAPSLLSKVIQNLMSPIDAANPLGKTEDYRMLLQGIVFQIATRLQHHGLVSHALELKFRAACAYDDALLSRIESAVRRWKTARITHAADQVKYQQHQHQQRSHVSSSPQVQSFLVNTIEPTLARMCAIAAMQPKEMSVASPTRSASPLVGSSNFFSEWLTAMAEWSPRAGPMLRFLDTPNKSLLPTSTAYSVALQSLLVGGEFDMAVALHLSAYDLMASSVSHTDKKQHHFPSTKELGQLVDCLTQEQDLHRVEQAQWIVDQHLSRERRRRKLSSREHQRTREHSSRFLDTAMLSCLIRAWITHGDFVNVRKQVDRMRKYELQPNKFFYSAFLKALVDLEPTIRNGRLVGGGDGQARHVGRRLAIQHMLHTRYLEDYAHALSLSSTSSTPSHNVSSALEEGWRILFQVIREQEERHADNVCPTRAWSSSGWSSADPSNFATKDSNSVGAEASLTGLDRMKNLVHQMVRVLSHGDTPQPAHVESNADELKESRFRPNIHIFSILLDAYSRRGNTEAILDLLADMSKLGIEPNEVVYTILANAFAKRQNLRAMDQIIRKAEQSGIDTGLYMHNIALNTLVKMEASPEKIHDFIHRMVRMARKQEDDDTSVDMNVTTSSSPSFATSRPVASLGEFRLSPSLLHGLDQVTLSTLINYHTKRRDVDSAEQILRYMTNAGFVPDKGTYYLVLGAYLKQHRTLAGLDLLRSMRSYARYVPDARAWKGLLVCAMKEQAWLDREQDRRGRQTRRSTNLQARYKHNPDQQQQAQQDLSLLEGNMDRESTIGITATTTRRSTRGLSASASDSSLVTQVLRELWATVSYLDAHDVLGPMTGKGKAPWTKRRGGGKSLQEKYVREVFASSSWMTLDQIDMEELAAWIQGIPNSSGSWQNAFTVEVAESNDGKGRHGLLRRILDHLLYEDHHHQSAAKQDIDRRCREALWIIQQVERHGLSLGDKWKWLVVGRRIEQLANWSPEQIRALLSTSYSTTSGPQ
ncbi:hypothetical protein BGW42_001652 [Actinomortierella wolfii]|nr:hypothetical protein BGW42_001652 [Actinomortierella wolfii]